MSFESPQEIPMISLAALPEAERTAVAERLRAKADEYHTRMDEARSVAEAAGTDIYKDAKFIDSAYKAFIAEAVLSGGELTKDETAARLAEHLPAPLYDLSFNNAWSVIESYVLHGGKGIRGGTGF
jgi:hypothetical protein